jgi:hypothetical protein
LPRCSSQKPPPDTRLYVTIRVQGTLYRYKPHNAWLRRCERCPPVANALIIARPVKGTTDVAGVPIPATTTNRPRHGVY